ncbi:hypothetical protein PHISCL_02400 [Aspergillus sclerotialis]|uniref:Zn(2)-C6 fungal-type domain-containing protein n=1 Tax=Aspergillus sclerotialis TaxID=2070753 RepID=A0A3A2ZRC1_9EURO|nr:hypothetical protein PHISCL_02400 [Aspergillus sclerotialis]
MTEQQTHLGTTANGYVLNRTASDRTNTKPESRVHKRRPRKPVSCVPCRDSKLKCDRQYPCASCKRRRCVESCFYYSRNQNNTQNTPVETTDRSASTWLPIQQYSRLEASIGSSTQNLSELLPEPVQADTTTPSQHDTHTQWDALLQRPIGQICQSEMSPNDPLEHTGNFCFPFSFGHAVSKQDILAILPPAHCCDYLVTEYFTRLSPLFHILHGPTFQKQYNEFRQDASAADLSWIALLFAICSATMSSLESDDSVLADIWPDSAGPHDISAVAYRFRTATMICLSQDQFLIRHNLSTLEALLLLIYAISNHEGAERAWTLLGQWLQMSSTDSEYWNFPEM